MKLFNKNIFKEGGRNPHVDWMMILSVFLIISVVFIVNNVILYKQVVSGDIQNQNQVNSTRGRTFSQKDGEIVTKDYMIKEAAVTKAQKGYTAYPDPSHP